MIYLRRVSSDGSAALGLKLKGLTDKKALRQKTAMTKVLNPKKCLKEPGNYNLRTFLL